MRELGEQKAQALAEALGKGRSLEEAAKAQGLAVQKSAPFATRRDPARPLLARARGPRLRDEAGPGREGGLRAAAGRRLRLARRGPAGARARSSRTSATGCGPTSWTRRPSPRRTRPPPRSGRRRRRSGSRRRPRPPGLVRKETPALTAPRPGAGRPRHRGRPRGGGLLAPREDDERPRAHVLRAGRCCACSRRSPSTRRSSRSRRRRSPRPCGSRSKSELFRAFVVEARDRYEITRDAQAWRRALGQEP